MKTQITVGIAGAGLMGRLLAWQLSRHGHSVSVFDPAPDGKAPSSGLIGANDTLPPCAAGFTAAGMLSPIAELENAGPEVADLGRQSFPLWQKIVLDLKHLTREDVFFQQLGSLMVAHRSDQGAAQRVLARLMQAPQSQQPTPLSTAESRSLEPALAPGLNVWFLPQEGQILPRQILSALYTASQNVQWHWNATVFDVAPHALTLSHQEIKQFDVVIDARGVGAKPQMPKIRGVRGELIWLHVPQVQLQRPIRLLHPRHRVYLTPRPDDIIVVGASEIESEDRSPVSLRSAVELMVAAQSVIPELAEARIVHLETNLRPALPDNHPHVHVEQGLIRVNGLFRHGWLVAPALAETVIDHCNRLTSSGAAIPEFEI